MGMSRAPTLTLTGPYSLLSVSPDPRVKFGKTKVYNLNRPYLLNKWPEFQDVKPNDSL